MLYIVMSHTLDFKNFYILEVDLQRHREGKIKMIIYGNDYIFFFRYEGDVYGGKEDARLTYSSMKIGDDKEAVEEMVFTANNLSAMMRGENPEEYFQPSDVDNIEVVKNYEAEHLLRNDE